MGRCGGARAFAAIVVEVTAAREGGRRGWREEAKREVKAGVEAEVRRPGPWWGNRGRDQGGWGGWGAGGLGWRYHRRPR